MILLCVTKPIQNMFVLKILNDGFIVNQQSKSISKPKFKLQRYNGPFVRKSLLKTEIAVPIVFKWHLRNL